MPVTREQGEPLRPGRACRSHSATAAAGQARVGAALQPPPPPSWPGAGEQGEPLRRHRGRASARGQWARRWRRGAGAQASGADGERVGGRRWAGPQELGQGVREEREWRE
ncbi:hypothetical protein PVAP13_1NG460819 [Panicum virgatum]|uniref:Uncharacterized protein n=1 Tax=Panicum virgatum TaxID=38727 RepID=A0A8T0X416_PANVG|nr:hypothetical protein PVAP13_1NG460819 [Panicum virgatum]